MSWFRKKKLVEPSTFYNFDHRLRLDCGCELSYSIKTKQLIKSNTNCNSEEVHVAEIKEDVEKEKWEQIKEMYRTFNGKHEVFGSLGGSGNF